MFNKVWVMFLILNSFQPIGNADFIVPVEIDGTVHQVCKILPHPLLNLELPVSLVFCPSTVRKWKSSPAGSRSSCNRVQVIQDRLCICLGLCLITCSWRRRGDHDDLWGMKEVQHLGSQGVVWKVLRSVTRIKLALLAPHSKKIAGSDPDTPNKHTPTEYCKRYRKVK